MKTYNKLCIFFFVVILSTATNYLKGQNILVNGDFEGSPTSSFGNNIGHSIAPWTLGSGQSANVVKVDGPGGYDYGNAGPQSDASGVTNASRHYLDIARGRNSFYQSFTPKCPGTVTVGGYFSTRADNNGTGSIEIRQGNGLNGTVIGQTVPVELTGGDSETDAWTPVSTQVNVQANQTYSFIVSMDNNMNFDEGYATYDIKCEESENKPSEDELCCPPLNQTEFLSMFSLDGDFQNHKVSFTPTQTWRKKMQAYTNWRHAMNPCLASFTFTAQIRKPKAGSTDQFDLAQNTVAAAIWITFKANDPKATCYTGQTLNTSNNKTHTFNATLPSNRRHKVMSGVWFNPTSCDGWKDGLCDHVGFEYILQVQGKSSTSGKISKVAQIIGSNNHSSRTRK